MPFFLSRPADARFGFTLIEMASVIVVIGLLAGGIVAGKSMIRATQLKSIISDFSHFRDATRNFKKKYGSLPGDMADATDYWGSATANGDGNGHIGEFAWSDTQAYEVHRAWQHLALSGFLSGSYTGQAADSSNQGALGPGVSEPPTSIAPNAGWRFHYIGGAGSDTSYAGDSNYFGGDYGDVVELIGSDGSTPILQPVDALSIDTKIDDGNPGLGMVLATSATNCTSSTTNYTVTNEDESCFLIFKLGL